MDEDDDARDTEQTKDVAEFCTIVSKYGARAELVRRSMMNMGRLSAG